MHICALAVLKKISRMMQICIALSRNRIKKRDMRHGIQQLFCKNVHLIKLSNFNYDKHFVKINLSGLERRLIGEISEIQKKLRHQ